MGLSEHQRESPPAEHISREQVQHQPHFHMKTDPVPKQPDISFPSVKCAPFVYKILSIYRQKGGK